MELKEVQLCTKSTRMPNNTPTRDENIKTVSFTYWFITHDFERIWLIIVKLCL